MKFVKRNGKMMRTRLVKRRNIADQYLLGYEYSVDASYLILGGGDITKKLVTQVDKYMGCRYKDSRVVVMDIDGAPHTVIRVNPKYVCHLKAQETFHQLYGALQSYLTDSDIKMCFYQLWMDETNYAAREEYIRSYNTGGRRVRRILKGADHGYVSHITTGMSRVEFARSGI